MGLPRRPYMEPGKLIPVQPLEEGDLPVFLAVLEAVDLSPNRHATFLYNKGQTTATY